MFQMKVVEKITTYIFCTVSFPPPHPENRAVYDVMWKLFIEPGRLQMTIWRMRVACWVPKA